MLNIDNISFGYEEKKVFKNFSLYISNGERICLFGESGCGKTTLLRLILGLEKPDSGKIIGLEDKKPAVVFQENRLLPFKTVLQNILITGSEKDKALECLNSIGLYDYKDAYPSDLSGGMKRRIAIARSIVYDYDYLVLDEPFTGLDKNNIEFIASYISKSVNNHNLIMVTHSEYEAKLLDAKIVYL